MYINVQLAIKLYVTILTIVKFILHGNRLPQKSLLPVLTRGLTELAVWLCKRLKQRRYETTDSI